MDWNELVDWEVAAARCAAIQPTSPSWLPAWTTSRARHPEGSDILARQSSTMRFT